MIDLAIYNKEGKEIESLKIDEAAFGGEIRYPLLKQALVMYHANKRVGTAATKGRGMVAGSTKKLFKQKGTGNARVGNRRTGKRIGGGVTFSKTVRDFSQRMPKKQRCLARDSAILAKLLSNNVVVIDELNFEKPKTREFAGVLNNLNIDRSCLVMVDQYDSVLYKSSRNIPKVDMTAIADLNAADICNHKKLLSTKGAFLSLLNSKKTDES